MDNFAEIKIDYDKKIIHWGDLYTQKQWIRGLNWKYVSRSLGYKNGLKPKIRAIQHKYIHHNGSGTKEGNQALTKKLGISPKKFAHMLRGAQYKLWIKGKEDLISKLCVVSGKWNFEKIQLLNMNWDVVDQYQKDGLDHLTPLAMYTGKSTKELKKILGKSLWKSFCKNSFYRNKFILNHCDKNHSYKLKNYLEFLNQIPTSIFRYSKSDIYFQNSFIWACETLKKKRLLTKCNLHLRDHFNICNDTERMAKRIGANFNFAWSDKRMNEMHNRYTIMVQTKQHPDTFIRCLRDIPIKEYSSIGYTAKLLDTPLKIAVQGKTQHHCVGSYVNSVREGRYLVYDIKDSAGETISTLGVSIYEKISYKRKGRKSPIGYRFSQHYKAFNKKVSYNEDLFAKQIIYELNKDEI